MHVASRSAHLLILDGIGMPLALRRDVETILAISLVVLAIDAGIILLIIEVALTSLILLFESIVAARRRLAIVLTPRRLLLI